MDDISVPLQDDVLYSAHTPCLDFVVTIMNSDSHTKVIAHALHSPTTAASHIHLYCTKSLPWILYALFN